MKELLLIVDQAGPCSICSFKNYNNSRLGKLGWQRLARRRTLGKYLRGWSSIRTHRFWASFLENDATCWCTSVELLVLVLQIHNPPLTGWRYHSNAEVYRKIHFSHIWWVCPPRAQKSPGFVFGLNLLLRLPQVDKVTGRFNGQFKTYAICGAIRRMVSEYSPEIWAWYGSLQRPPPPWRQLLPAGGRVCWTVFTCKCLCVSCRENLTTPSWGWPRTTASSPSKASSYRCK